jgi:hypothetical protein
MFATMSKITSFITSAMIQKLYIEHPGSLGALSSSSNLINHTRGDYTHLLSKLHATKLWLSCRESLLHH